MIEYTIRINLRCTSSLSLSLSPRVWVMDRVPRRGWWESEHQAGLGNVVTEVLLDSVWKKDNDMDPITDGYSILYVSIIFFLLRWGFSFFPVVQRHIFFFFLFSFFFPRSPFPLPFLVLLFSLFSSPLSFLALSPLFSFSLPPLKATPNNRAVFLRTRPASFFLPNPRASRVRGASLLPAVHSRLGFLSGWVCEPE